MYNHILLAACSTGDEAVDESTNRGGRLMDPTAFSDAFLAGDYEKIYRQMSKAFQDEVPLKQLKALGDEFNKDITTNILHSEIPYGNGTKQYAWTDDSGSKGMVAIFDEDDIIQGLQIMPL